VSYPRYPKYKDSEVEWLGEVPEHWEVIRLKHVAAVLPSNVDKKSYEGEKSVQLCNYTDVYYNDLITPALEFMPATASNEQIARFSLRAGDAVLTKDSETADDIAIAAYVPQDLPGVICGYHLAIIRPGAQCSGAFIKRVFDSAYVKATVEVRANGLTRVGLSQSALNNLEVARPPIEEQVLIAQAIDSATARIDKLIVEQQRLIGLLSEKRWAVISHAVTKGPNPDAPMEPSGVEWLGAVPEHWTRSSLKRACILLKDGTHLPPARVSDGVPLLSVRNIIDGQFVLRDDDSLISEASYEELSRSFVPRPDDVLLAIVGATLGKTAIVGAGMGRFHVQRSLAVFRTRADVLLPRYLNLFFQSRGFQSMLWQQVGYSAQPGIYLGTLENVPIMLPPIDEQHRIIVMTHEQTGVLDELMSQAERAILLLQERRAALISAAVTGKIDVRELVDAEAA
jgi:type I restriction enzyme, S subunit